MIRQWRRWRDWLEACPKSQKGSEVVCSMPKVAERCRGGLQHAQSRRKVQRWFLGIGFEVMCLGMSLVQVFMQVPFSQLQKMDRLFNIFFCHWFISCRVYTPKPLCMKNKVLHIYWSNIAGNYFCNFSKHLFLETVIGSKWWNYFPCCLSAVLMGCVPWAALCWRGLIMSQ